MIYLPQKLEMTSKRKPVPETKMYGTRCCAPASVLRSGFTELGDALIGVPHLMSLTHHIYGAQPLDVATLEWANAQNKLAIESIDPTSSDDILIKAAELSIPPSAIIVNDEFQSGGEYLSNTASVDIIAAYLNAGIDEGFDPKSASRRNDERLAGRKTR